MLDFSDPIIIMALSFVGVTIVMVTVFMRLSSAKEKEILSLKKDLSESRETLEKEREKLSSLPSHVPMHTSLISEQLKKIEQLEAEVQRQKERVEDAKAIALEAVRVKYDFLTNIRHEIRTPLNSILSFAELLGQSIQNPQLQSYAKNIALSGEKLLVLMDKIIELSRLEAGTYEIRESAVDIRYLFDNIIHEHRHSALTKGLTLGLHVDSSLPDMVMIDAKKVKSIVDNLISNAIKFTNSGFVEVEVRKSAQNLQKSTLDLEIVVKDSGVGIAKNEQKKLFDTFEKVLDTEGFETHSAGLGLSIDKKKAKLMGGDLLLQKSNPKEGSVFVLKLFGVEAVLPSAEEERSEEGSIDFSLIRPDGAKVMLIYKDTSSRDALVEPFLSTHVEIQSFHDPREALEVLKQNSYDLLVVDMEILTDDEGAVAKMIAKLSDAPLVSLTHLSPKNTTLNVPDLHVVGHIRKPVSKQHLFKLFLKVLNSPELLHVKEKEDSDELFKGVEQRHREYFLKLHTESLESLYENAKATKDLAHIKHFAKELFKVASITHIEYFSTFAKELFSNIEFFDIDAINRQLNRYKTDVKLLESSKR